MISIARKAVLMSWFAPYKAVRMLDGAKRICINGETRRYGFADGSVMESVSGKWRVVK